MSIVEFPLSKGTAYISASSIVGILPDIVFPLDECRVYCEEPVGALTVSMPAEDAALLWYVGLDEYEDEDEDPNEDWIENVVSLDERQ